jgi:hypothetical protein
VPMGRAARRNLSNARGGSRTVQRYELELHARCTDGSSLLFSVRNDETSSKFRYEYENFNLVKFIMRCW